MQASGLQLARTAIITLLIIGVLWVLRPFLSPLLTALIGNCPLYSILGVNTCGVKKNQ